jgi:putative ABC transport system substrate-binding protein
MCSFEPIQCCLLSLGADMQRREFITLLGGAATAWPLDVRAQPTKMRRIGVLSAFAKTDPEGPARLTTFQQGLERLGWTVGRNVQIDFRWTAGGTEGMSARAKELVELAPDVIMVQSNPGVAALRQITRMIPIVFVSVADPVESGFVESLARPGGNVTGFTNFEASMGGKWLEALKEIAPGLKRVLAILQIETAANAGFLRAAESAAPSLGVALTAGSVHNAAEIDRAVTAFIAAPNGGLIVMPHPVTAGNRELILRLTAQHRLPAIYPFRYFAAAGGLMSYGVDQVDMYRRAVTYVDRILRGAKPEELPVQASNKFELVINLKTAKALGLDVSSQLQQRADELVE